MEIRHDVSLKNYNTFGIDAKARRFVSVTTEAELIDVLKSHQDAPKFIIGGGSNMLLTRDLDELVIHIAMKGKEIVREDDDTVEVRCMGGEAWHDFVMWAISHDFGGIENMSLIPGNVGTSPVQNIGAYGVEIKDTFVSCDAVAIATGERRHFSLEECRFGYRESIFKNEVKGQYIITSVIFRLTKRHHVIRTDYGDIQAELARNGVTTPTIRDVSNAVITIRQSKLPDPKELGNSGSFFKNPVIPMRQFETLKERFPDIRHFPVSDTEVKVPAGWLIEQAGMKGFRDGDAGVHKNQALVLVNYGNASGQDIIALSKKVQAAVTDKFGIAIEAEVNLV